MKALFALVFGLVAAGSAATAEPAVGSLGLVDARVRATDATEARAYVNIVNPGIEDKLIGVRCECDAQVSLRQAFRRDDSDILGDRPLASLTIPSNATTFLEPFPGSRGREAGLQTSDRAYIDLGRTALGYDRKKDVVLVLTFERAGELRVPFRWTLVRN